MGKMKSIALLLGQMLLVLVSLTYGVELYVNSSNNFGTSENEVRIVVVVAGNVVAVVGGNVVVVIATAITLGVACDQKN